MTELAKDETGAPVLLSGIEVPTKSGNPSHVPAGGPGGGRFAARRKKGEPDPDKETSPQMPRSITPDEIARRMDAVREAAREFEDFSIQDVMDWLKGKTNRELSPGEIKAFAMDVRAQQITDLVDILDQAGRGSGRARRHVKVQAPRGYTRKSIGGLSDDEVRSIALRLRARGWTTEQVKKGLVGRLPKDRKETVQGVI